MPTPGHTPSHVSVIVVQNNIHVFLAGDASYNEASLCGLVDGVSPNVALSAATLETIRNHSRQHTTIYLPNHDPASATLLKNDTFLAI